MPVNNINFNAIENFIKNKTSAKANNTIFIIV